MAWRIHDSDVYNAFPDDDLILQDIRSLTEKIIDFSSCASWIALWSWACHYLGFSRLFPFVTMSEYLRFPFLSGIFIMQGAVVPANHSVGQNTTPPLSTDQPILDKTNSQWEVEVEDPKVVAAREKKRAQVARIAAKKKESRKKGNNEEGSSKAKKKKIPAGVKSASENSDHVSSLFLYRRLLRLSRFTVGIMMGRQPVHPAKEAVFLFETNADGSSHPLNDLSIGAPVETLRRVGPLEVILCIILGRPSHGDSVRTLLTRGAMAQADLLESFENLLADYDTLVETHFECSETVQNLVALVQKV
ncbi:hypothetical protein Tco_0814667, partial [Tanacetum coccineum]